MPRPSHRWHVLGLCAAGLLILASGGCRKKTVLGPGEPVTATYLSPTSPQNVLQNLVRAYVMRDSVETAAVYDGSYQGTSTNPSAPIPISNFSRWDEIRHVEALKRNNNIVSVFLDLGPPATWHRLPPDASDPADWAVIPIPASTVRIDDAGTATLWESVNRVIEFKFKPTVNGPTDTTWAVVRWTENVN